MKLRLGLLAVLLAATAMVGCAPTEDDYKNWASENGYVQNPDYAGWASENGYVQNPDYAGWAEENGYSKLEVLPAARLEGKTTYNTADSGIQIAPKEGSGAKKLVDYLDREDVVYIDLRGGADYNKGHIEGFEWVPHFDIIMANGGAKGDQLFYTDGEGKIQPRYEESKAILNAIFPKDRTIFLMCKSGGRVAKTMDVLAANGYDMSKIYNVGGYDSADKSYPITAKGSPIGTTTTFNFSTLTKIGE